MLAGVEARTDREQPSTQAKNPSQRASAVAVTGRSTLIVEMPVRLYQLEANVAGAKKQYTEGHVGVSLHLLLRHHIYMRPPRMDTAQLSLIRQPFDDPNFLFELKHDGFRALAHIWDGHCELISRRRNSYKSFQELRDNLAKLKVKNAVIDGEIVCLDAEGRSIFNELLFRRGCPTFYAFDLLYLNGRDLRQLPLLERKGKLRALIEKSGLPDVICGKYVEGRGIDLFNEVVRLNLEGVVAKRKTGTYSTVSGWLKIKNPLYTQSERRHELFDSFKAKEKTLPPIPKKPPLRSRPLNARRAKTVSK